MNNSLSFFSPGMPRGLSRSPGRRPRTVKGGSSRSRSSATRLGSAPKSRGSKPAGHRRARAVTEPPPGRPTRPGTPRAARGRRAGTARAPAWQSRSPAPSRWPRTPPGRSQLRPPAPGETSASMWRREKSAGAPATVRSAASSARDNTAGGVRASNRGGKRNLRGPAAAAASGRAARCSSRSLSRRSISPRALRRSTMRGL